MTENKKIIHIFIFICFLFLLLAGYLTYIQLFESTSLSANPYNNRNQQLENDTLRGSIFDRNGKLLAYSKKTGDKQTRIYPFNNLYSQLIGYDSKIYGKSQLEKQYDNYLVNRNIANPLLAIKNAFNSKEKTGNDLYLTIDNKLQTLSRQLIGNRNGAVVAMDPKTGEILAMVSKPDFNPNSSTLEANWQNLAESSSHPFLPRATQGLYNPGSTFKIVISTAAFENGMGTVKMNDKGSVIIDGRQIKNEGGSAYGNIDIGKALSVSSNVYFSQIAVQLGQDRLKEITSRFELGKEIPFNIPLEQSSFGYRNMSKADMASAGIGQGKVLVTPLQMAMITSAIANKGNMMRPMLVNRISTHDGLLDLKNYKSSLLAHVTDSNTAAGIKKIMQEVVDKGTGRNAAIRGISVAGKTGTAENEFTGIQNRKEHSWFIGFAPVEDPQIVVAVILEYNGSSGGSVAAPIARSIISEYLNNR
ncbi:MAG: penicillin-binding transpeptidase domain-containing protein [Bacillota bacterium]|nr:penicillin-binding transpeptidase domain-containing protein [Bacillota bacterium]